MALLGAALPKSAREGVAKSGGKVQGTCSRETTACLSMCELQNGTHTIHTRGPTQQLAHSSQAICMPCVMCVFHSYLTHLAAYQHSSHQNLPSPQAHRHGGMEALPRALCSLQASDAPLKCSISRAPRCPAYTPARHMYHECPPPRALEPHPAADATRRSPHSDPSRVISGHLRVISGSSRPRVWARCAAAALTAPCPHEVLK